MKIALLGCSLLALALTTGCRLPWEPEIGSIHGIVRFPDGRRSNLGYVGIRKYRTWERTSLGRIDYTGRYALFPGGAVGDTVLVDAWNYCTGSCMGSSYGFVRIVLTGTPVVVDIVMDHQNDI